MKRLVIIVLVLLVVAGGGAGGLVMLGIVRNPFLKVQPKAEMKPGDEAPNGFKAPAEALSMVKVPDMIVPVIIDGAVKRRISVGLRLVTHAADKPRVLAELPKFQDALLQDLVTYFQDYFQRADMIDIEAVRQKARSDAERVYGEAVSDILLTNVFETGVSSGGKGTFSTAE